MWSHCGVCDVWLRLVGLSLVSRASLCTAQPCRRLPHLVPPYPLAPQTREATVVEHAAPKPCDVPPSPSCLPLPLSALSLRNQGTQRLAGPGATSGCGWHLRLCSPFSRAEGKHGSWKVSSNSVQDKGPTLEPVDALGLAEYMFSPSLPPAHGTIVTPRPLYPWTWQALPLLSGAHLMQVSPCALLLLRPKGNRAALPRPEP